MLLLLLLLLLFPRYYYDAETLESQWETPKRPKEGAGAGAFFPPSSHSQGEDHYYASNDGDGIGPSNADPSPASSRLLRSPMAVTDHAPLSSLPLAAAAAAAGGDKKRAEKNRGDGGTSSKVLGLMEGVGTSNSVSSNTRLVS